MAKSVRFYLTFVLGVVMIAIGAFIASRPLWNAPPATGSRALDMAFAAVVLLRGVMNLRSVNRVRRPPVE